MRFWLLTVFIILTGIPPDTEAASGFTSSGWNRVSVPGLDKAWRNSALPGHMIAFVKYRADFPLGFKGRTSHEIVSGLAGMREVALLQFGFSEWKLNSFNHHTDATAEIIQWSGSYKRPDGSVVQFIEHQYYSKNVLNQFTYTLTGGRTAKEVQDIHKYLNQLSRAQQRLPADDTPAEAEGKICENCDGPPGPITEISKSARSVLELAEAQNEEVSCENEKSFLFNPEQKSILESVGIPASSDSDLPTMVGRSTLSCFFGAGAGIYGSLRDLVKAVPTLLGLGWNAVKGADYSGIMSSLSPRNLWNSTKNLYEVTTSSIGSAYKSSTEFIYKSYEAGGIMGSMAAVAEAASSLRPSQVVGPFLAKIGAKIAEVVSQEWKGFKCMSPEVMTETVCKVFGYIATDVLTGKLALSALQNGTRISSALKVIGTRAEELPVVGSWLTRNLKRIPTDECKAVQSASWMRDTSVTVQGKNVDVSVLGDRILAKGVDVKTGAGTCFEVLGKTASAIKERVLSTQKRAEAPAIIKAPELQEDIFSSSSKAYARTNEEFVQQAGHSAGVSMSSSQARRIAKTFENDPQGLEKFGDVLRSTQGIKEQLSRTPKNHPDYAKMLSASKSSDKVMEGLQTALVKNGTGKDMNMDLVNHAYNEALLTKDPEALNLLSDALSAYNKVSNGNLDQSLQAWKLLMKKEKPQISNDDLEKVGRCLFKNGVR